MRPADPAIVSAPQVCDCIRLLRGRRVLIDADLARFYGVTTKRLNEQVRRNPDRFPDDFLFRLTADEAAELVANCDRFATLKHSTVLPQVFTEHGALMAASVLNTPQAIRMSVHVVRAFVAMRQVLSGASDLLSWLRKVDHRLDDHDEALRLLVQAVEELAAPVGGPRPGPIGFRPDPDDMA